MSTDFETDICNRNKDECSCPSGEIWNISNLHENYENKAKKINYETQQ